MSDWLIEGIPRNIAEDPDMGTVRRIRESIREDNGQTLESDMLMPCPFCGCDHPFVQTHDFGECTVEARVVCSRCHVATSHEYQSWRVSYAGDDITRTLAIGRAISRWNRRAERTCRIIAEGNDRGRCSACGYEYDWYDMAGLPTEEPFEYEGRYCKSCGAKVLGE